MDSLDLAHSVLSRRAPGIGMQFDAYHVSRMGLDLLPELERALPYVRHVQFADVPGRHEPGAGGVPFLDMLGTLLDAQYAGWLGAEYFPSGSTNRSLHWLADWRATMSARSLSELAAAAFKAVRS